MSEPFKYVSPEGHIMALQSALARKDAAPVFLVRRGHPVHRLLPVRGRPGRRCIVTLANLSPIIHPVTVGGDMAAGGRGRPISAIGIIADMAKAVDGRDILAEKVGVSTRTLAKYSNNELNPRPVVIKVLRNLARAHGIKPVLFETAGGIQVESRIEGWFYLENGERFDGKTQELVRLSPE